MNRIVQRQGAAPPWVELQQECDRETEQWRLRLREDWRRRAIRMLTLSGGPPPPLDAVHRHRDSEWVAREAAYHAASVRDLNGLVRRYNGAAPAAVRRSPLLLKTELQACFADQADVIHAELGRREREGPGSPVYFDKGEGRGQTGGNAASGLYTRPVEAREGMFTALKRALADFKAIMPSARSP